MYCALTPIRMTPVINIYGSPTSTIVPTQEIQFRLGRLKQVMQKISKSKSTLEDLTLEIQKDSIILMRTDLNSYEDGLQGCSAGHGWVRWTEYMLWNGLKRFGEASSILTLYYFLRQRAKTPYPLKRRRDRWSSMIRLRTLIDTTRLRAFWPGSHKDLDTLLKPFALGVLPVERLPGRASGWEIVTDWSVWIELA